MRSRFIMYFYPRPPRGGRPFHASVHAAGLMDFYPRPPRGGRPCERTVWSINAADFYPRPPRGGRRVGGAGRQPTKDISIHALREEGDTTTPSLSQAWMKISIHALREEGDTGTTDKPAPYEDFYPRPPRGGRREPAEGHFDIRNFYPRPPRGGRRSLLIRSPMYLLFLSTPSARRATAGG